MRLQRDNETFAATALNCVRLLRSCVPEDAELSHLSAMVTASLTSMIQTARFLENAVLNDAEMGKLELLLCARAHRPRSGTQAPQTVVLWSGKELDPKAIVPPYPQLADQSNDASPGLPVAHGPAPARKESQDEDSELQEQLLANRVPNQPSVTVGQTLSEQYEVPEAIAARCLSFLFDGTGLTTHRGPTQEILFKDVCSRLIQQPIRSVMEKEQEKMGMGRSAQKKKLKYLGLVPKELRNREIVVPFGCLRRSQSQSSQMEVRRRLKVKLDIKKPDRNTKEQTFAVLCILLHAEGDVDGICGTVLKAFARKGLGRDGCVIRKQHNRDSSGLQVGRCGGPETCRMGPTGLSEFYEGVVRQGAGIVDPLCSFLEGGNVPPSCFAVRFAGDEDRKLPILWRKNCIQRILLLGEYKVEVASAILVHEKPNLVTTNVRERRPLPNGLQSGTAANDIDNSVIVCDVKLKNPERDGSKAYPYAVWYSIRSLAFLKCIHFEDKFVPATLKGLGNTNTVAALWHEDWIKRQ